MATVMFKFSDSTALLALYGAAEEGLEIQYWTEEDRPTFDIKKAVHWCRLGRTVYVRVD